LGEACLIHREGDREPERKNGESKILCRTIWLQMALAPVKKFTLAASFAFLFLFLLWISDSLLPVYNKNALTRSREYKKGCRGSPES
jgi:hypothetical protein